MMKFLRTQMKWIMAVIVVAFLLSTFLMYEGRSTRRSPGRNPDGTMTDYEVAQINGRSLMRSELEQRLRNYLSTYSSRSMTSIDMPAIYRTVLNQAILESQIAKEVDEKGIRVSDAEADMAMKNYADTYFPTREAFYQVLANSGIKPEDYKRSIARQLASDRLIREAIGSVTVSDDSVASFYDTMKGILYSRPEGFTIHMADFNTSADAESFRAKITGGESWDVLASGDVAGSINITKSPVMLPLSALTVGTLSVLASIDVGTVTPVFEVASGDYAVAMKAAHVEAGTTPYNEVSGDIRMLLTQQEERSRLTAYQNSLMQKANVVINDEELFASPAASNESETSEDVLPIMNLHNDSEDTQENETVSSEAEPVEPDEPEENEPDEPEDTPVMIESASEDKTAETETVTVNDVAVSEDKAVEPETPSAKTKSIDEPEAPEKIEEVIVKASEDESVSTEETPKSNDVPVIEEAKPEDTPAVVEAVSEDSPVEPEKLTEKIEKSEDLTPVQPVKTETSENITTEVSSDK